MPTITDLYKILFGRKGIQEGSVIDMAEHGRAGGIQAGQGYKFVRDVDECLLVDKVDANTIYIGKTQKGKATSTSEAVFQIKKVAITGTVTVIAFADGNDNYDNVWDDRVSLTYS